MKPIPFSTDMVKAILSGQKTVTRRLNGLEKINSEPGAWLNIGITRITIIIKGKITQKIRANFVHRVSGEVVYVNFPYGIIDSWLWVRESFCKTESGYLYKADGSTLPDGYRWKSGRFMPKEAARIHLQISNLDCQRLHNISDNDAVCEGVELLFPQHLYKNYMPGTEPHEGFSYPSSSFESLWRHINGSDSWQHNPWVWVIKFTVITK